ncbi:MAG: nucleotidyl transferase AbiEii/AbiGii toxin family protein [Patescibacteria group bacterium]
MVSPPKINKNLEKLRLSAIPKTTSDAFLKCIALLFFSQNGWYLAGGTALALQTGHRSSIDLDFFTIQKSFDEKNAEETFSIYNTWKTSSLNRGTLYGELNGAKISLISYPFFKASKPFLKVGTVSIMSPQDIAAMKIAAISQRGKKRDFFDLYWLSLNIQPLKETVRMAQNQYSVKQNLNHILKSLTYFDDAESDPDPKIYFKTTWKEVKSFFQQEIKKISKEIF